MRFYSFSLRKKRKYAACLENTRSCVRCIRSMCWSFWSLILKQTVILTAMSNYFLSYANYRPMTVAKKETLLHTIDFYMYPPLFSFWNISVVIQYHTNCNNSYLCDLQQKNDVTVNLLNGPTIYSYSREWKYSTNVNCHCQSKTEERKGCNYYLPYLKSDCNNGGKLL